MAIGWAPAEPGRRPAGHTFVWRLTAERDSTMVSLTYDWSSFTHHTMRHHLPVLGRDQLSESVDRLVGALAPGGNR